MALAQVERILILAKTYPSPSAQYVETSCVAGINANGVMRRLYPVPFRLISEQQQFKKWQWVEVRVEKASSDHRPESHRLFVDTIKCQEEIDTRRGWGKRFQWLDKAPSFANAHELEAARGRSKISLGWVRPKRIVNLEIVRAREADWTDDEREKLLRQQMQGDLFSEQEERNELRNQLRKLPYDFYYNYVCDTVDGEKTYRHKIIDWEAGALYWRCCKDYGEKWEAPFRARLEEDFGTKDLVFLMGNMHRFQDQWLIISLIYPPRQRLPDDPQGALF